MADSSRLEQRVRKGLCELRELDLGRTSALAGGLGLVAGALGHDEAIILDVDAEVLGNVSDRVVKELSKDLLGDLLVREGHNVKDCAAESILETRHDGKDLRALL